MHVTRRSISQISGLINQHSSGDILTQQKSQDSRSIIDASPRAASQRRFCRAQFHQSVSFQKAAASTPSPPTPSIHIRSRADNARVNNECSPGSTRSLSTKRRKLLYISFAFSCRTIFCCEPEQNVVGRSTHEHFSFLCWLRGRKSTEEQSGVLNEVSGLG